MSRIALAGLFVLCVLCGSLTLAQNYRCDWNVCAIGGGEMGSTAYRCGSTAGQTAAGPMTTGNLMALIGFWQPDYGVGIEERDEAVASGGALVTRLCAVAPNPARGRAVIRYTLAAQGPVLLQVHDLTGRVVATLAGGVKRPGRYSVTWDGGDKAGGVYLVRLRAGEYRSTQKVVLGR